MNRKTSTLSSGKELRAVKLQGARFDRSAIGRRVPGVGKRKKDIGQRIVARGGRPGEKPFVGDARVGELGTLHADSRNFR